jgi:two-component system, sensor histidine kinase and response regulator
MTKTTMEALKEKLIEQIRQSEQEALLKKMSEELDKIQEGQKNTSVFDELAAAHKVISELKEKSEKFASIISYELGSPLNSLKSMSDLLMLDIAETNNPMLNDTANYMANQIDALQQKMANLIEWTSLEVGNFSLKKELFSLQEMLETIWESYSKTAAAKGIILKPLPITAACVYADPKMIKVVLNNLINNAVKFCRKTDRIEVFLEETEETWQMTIQDSGIGIGSAKMQHIFNVGRKSTQRGTANEAGLGLGLVTTKALLQLHQTDLQLVSDRGKGLKATFVLPKKEE